MTKPWSPQDYDAWYETPLGRLSDRLEKELIFSMIDAKPGNEVLDVGCGTGNYTIELAKRGADVVGIDSSEEMVAFARQKVKDKRLEEKGTVPDLTTPLIPLLHKEGSTKCGVVESGLSPIKGNMRFFRADALKLPFHDVSFDLILSIGLLCFLKEPEKALGEMHRVLKPGGRLVIGTLNKWSPWALFRRVKGMFKETIYYQARFISPPELEKMVKRAGFRLEELKTCLFFLPLNSSPYLKLAVPFERLDRVIIPKTGAFLAVSAVK